MTPIEKVARAICTVDIQSFYDDMSPELVLTLTDSSWEDHISEARAAIRALVENVSDEMVFAATQKLDWDTQRDKPAAFYQIRAALLAALEEK